MTPRPWLRTYSGESVVHQLAVEHDAASTLCGLGWRDDVVEGVELPGEPCAWCAERVAAGAVAFLAEVVEEAAAC